MAYLDSADLLAKLKALLARPSTDEITDASLYLLLTDAQAYWTLQIANIFPEVLYGTPEAATSSDSGLTYTVTNEPVGPMSVMDGLGGPELRPGSYTDNAADYVPEGKTLRMARGRARTFSNGLYVRYVSQPGTLDGSTAPTLKPPIARLLLPPRAAIVFASSGGLYDPAPYEREEQRRWMGDGVTDFGIYGILRKMVGNYAMTGDVPWWRLTGDLA